MILDFKSLIDNDISIEMCDVGISARTALSKESPPIRFSPSIATIKSLPLFSSPIPRRWIPSYTKILPQILRFSPQRRDLFARRLAKSNERSELDAVPRGSESGSWPPFTSGSALPNLTALSHNPFILSFHLPRDKKENKKYTFAVQIRTAVFWHAMQYGCKGLAVWSQTANDVDVSF